MNDFEEYERMLVGKTLTNLFFTEQDGPHDYCPGIPPAYFFSTIMELDNGIKLRFHKELVLEWKDEEPIFELTNENWFLPKSLVFRGKKIVSLSKDEFDQLTFHLENGTTIMHKEDYGNQLFIRNDNSIFKNEHHYNRERTSLIDRLVHAGKKFRQQLFGSD